MQQRKMTVIKGLADYFKDLASVLIAFIVISAVFGILSPAFLAYNNIMTILRQGSLSSLIAFGMTMVIISGGIDLSVGGVMCLTGIIAAFVYVNWGLPIWLMIVFTLAVGLFIGLVNGVIVSYAGLPPFIATLGMQLITNGLGGIVSNNRAIQMIDDRFNNLALGRVGDIPILIFYMLFFLIVLGYVLSKTKFGRYIYAIGGNAVTAKYSGINVRLITMLVYVISGGMAALTGILTTAKLYSGQPSVGGNAEIDAISAVVIGGAAFSGGKGKALGTVVGVLLICVIANGLNLFGVSTFWQKVANGAIIIFAVSLDTLRNKVGFANFRKRSGRQAAHE